LKVAAAIIIFRLVSAVLEIIHHQIMRIPYEFARTLEAYSSIVLPAIAVACAVLISSWPEQKLKGARRNVKIRILVLLLVLAFLPLQFRIRATPVEVPSVEWMEIR